MSLIVNVQLYKRTKSHYPLNRVIIEVHVLNGKLINGIRAKFLSNSVLTR